MAMTARAIQLRREGRDIVSLSVGEPDFPVFPHVEQAVSEALRKGYTKYTASNGILELREAISDWTNREVGVRWPAAQIVATSGAKQALYNACMALLDEGDEAVIPSPYWVSYPEMVRLAGAKPVELMLRQEDGWAPRSEDLERLLTPRTRVFMFSSPSNPTGGIWSADVMRGIARVLEKFPKVVVLSDDIYDKLVYGGVEAANGLQGARRRRACPRRRLLRVRELLRAARPQVSGGTGRHHPAPGGIAPRRVRRRDRVGERFRPRRVLAALLRHLGSRHSQGHGSGRTLRGRPGIDPKGEHHDQAASRPRHRGRAGLRRALHRLRQIATR